MPDKHFFDKYLEYIDNTGGEPTIEQFDEDWEPIGPIVRMDMIEAGVATMTTLGKIKRKCNCEGCR